MDKIITMPNKLNIDKYSYQFLAKLQYDIYSCNESSVILDFNTCQFTAPAFTAYYGALIAIAQGWNKKIYIEALQNKKIMNYFKRSGLYDYYSDTSTSHINKNSIPFSKVNLDDEYIVNYIDTILRLAPINLSDACRDLLFKNIFEIFSNATEHSKSHYGVYACGHWMPNKNQLIFSVCDTGIGIPRLIKQQNSNIASTEAVRWALQRGNSTKQLTDGVPRGLGMADLKDFTKINKGALIIFSNDVYYNCSDNEIGIQLPYDIVGTLITVVITADYQHVYFLKEEHP